MVFAIEPDGSIENHHQKHLKNCISYENLGKSGQPYSQFLLGGRLAMT